jgi:hypothetical protein
MAYSDLSQEERLALSPAERSKLVRQDLQGTKPSEPDEKSRPLTVAEAAAIVEADARAIRAKIAALREGDHEQIARAFQPPPPPPAPKKYFELSTEERLALSSRERAALVRRDLGMR